MRTAFGKLPQPLSPEKLTETFHLGNHFSYSARLPYLVLFLVILSLHIS